MTSWFVPEFSPPPRGKAGLHVGPSRALAVIVCFFAWNLQPAQSSSEEIPEITAKYQFLTADDTLALLEEDGTLKGYVDVFQGEEESDEVLSYPITLGWRKKDRVEFKTAKIHQKYYRFAGVVERGTGHTAKDPDYLRLAGDLEIVTGKGDGGEEVAQRVHVVFKSLGGTGREEE